MKDLIPAEDFFESLFTNNSINRYERSPALGCLFAQNSFCVLYYLWSADMSYDVLEKTYKTLTAEQQAIVYTLVLSLGNMNVSTKQSDKIMSKKEKLDLFEKFNGSMKVPADFDPKKEYLRYLDERYN